MISFASLIVAVIALTATARSAAGLV